MLFRSIPEDIDTDHVIDDNFKLGYEAVTHLISQGCKKIAHFAGPQSLLEYQERFSGYKKALEDHNIKYEDKYVVYDSITMKTGVDATNYLLNLDDLPDAIFAAGDYSAITAIDTILKAGLKVPQDIAVLGVANEPIVNYLNPSLSSFELFNRQMGEKTAHLLMRRLDKSDEINVLYEGNISETNNVHIVINPELVIRNSSKKVL